MLTRPEPTPRNLRRERRLWHDESRNMPSLGCLHCREQAMCGALRMKAAFFDCLQFCCGEPASCDRVCRNHPDYVDRVREVGGFAFDNVPRAHLLDAPELPRLVPVIFHGNCRASSVPFAVAALPLYRMFDRRSGAPRFADHVSLCAAFGIAPGTKVMLTGTDRDPPLERWWRRQSRANAGCGAGRAAARSATTVQSAPTPPRACRWHRASRRADTARG